MPNDHFAKVAHHYAQGRPRYPDELFDWLAQTCRKRELAWDVGAGSGQATITLARHFRKVWATDASKRQIAEATQHPRIEYRVAPAEASGLESRSVDLVTVAQALHWFDLEAFYEEVRRVLKPQGRIAVWTYGILHVEGDDVDRVIGHYYRDVVGPYWPAERRHVENGYADLPFPFALLPAPPFTMRARWDLDRLLGYLRTWSATARMQERTGIDPVADVEPVLASLWGPRSRPREVIWPLTLKVGTV